MKKIISILLVIVFISSNFSFWQVFCGEDNRCNEDQQCIDNGKDDPYCETIIQEESDNVKNRRAKCSNWSINESNINYINMDVDGNCCFEWTQDKNTTTLDICDPNKLQENQQTWLQECQTIMGITCCEDQLVNGQCKFNINETLGIKKWETNSVGILVQDVVLSATFFIGTVVTIALVVSWLMYIFAASSGKDPGNAKKGIIGSIIGLMIVASSYIIIRLVQYLAKGF